MMPKPSDWMLWTDTDLQKRVLGLTKYASDLTLPGTLHLKVVRSQIPYGLVKRIDISKAIQTRGVRAIITASDIPGENAHGGLFVSDHPVLADTRVRFMGEGLALVVAENLRAAEDAARLVLVEYNPLPGIFDPVEAMKPDAPQLASDGNIVSHWKLRKGDVELGFRKADIIVENTYQTPCIEHAHLDVEAGIAWVDDDDVVNLVVASQDATNTRFVAAMLGIPDEKVRLIVPPIGGGFGARLDITVECYLALAAWKTRSPVQIRYTREESMIASVKRHPFVMHYKTGAMQDGRIVAWEAKTVADAGAYVYESPLVLQYYTMGADWAYDISNVKVDSYAVLTNNTPASAMRGFGVTQGTFAAESQVDEVARALGLSPLEVRRKNFLRKGGTLAIGQTLERDTHLVELMENAFSILGKRESSNPGKKIGRGLAATMLGYGAPTDFADASSCKVALRRDGKIIVQSTLADIGGGQGSLCGLIVSKTLDVHPEAVIVELSDTLTGPHAYLTGGSRVAYMLGNALVVASKNLAEQILNRASIALGVNQDAIVLRGNHVIVANSGVEISLADLAQQVWEEVESRSEYAIESEATFAAPATEPTDPETGKHNGWPDYTFGVHAAEVEIDVETGEITILKYALCYDVGYALNPPFLKAQLEGGAVMGLGYALLENVILDQGVTSTPSLSEFLIPTSLDVPQMQISVSESELGVGPWGAKGIGEIATNGPAPVIANAICDALGIRLTELPLTAEKIALALVTAKSV
jgi:CO/xanthine dehydrogenase Mo-binding subunit